MTVNWSMSLSGDVQSVIRALVAQRKALGLRQADMAEAVGVGQQYISTIERGLFEPSFSQLQRYAAVLGAQVRIDVSWPGRSIKIERRTPHVDSAAPVVDSPRGCRHSAHRAGPR